MLCAILFVSSAHSGSVTLPCSRKTGESGQTFTRGTGHRQEGAHEQLSYKLSSSEQPFGDGRFDLHCQQDSIVGAAGKVLNCSSSVFA